MYKVVIIFLILCLFTNVLLAQTAGMSVASPNTSAFSYSGTMNEQDQLKIYTYIWGQIQKPGLYIVPDDTDILTLISLAGGPKEDAKLKSVRIVRSSAFGEEQIIMVDMKKYVETGNYSLIPQLLPGDTVIIPGTSFYAFSRVADFLSKVAITLSVYATIRNLSK